MIGSILAQQQRMVKRPGSKAAMVILVLMTAVVAIGFTSQGEYFAAETLGLLLGAAGPRAAYGQEPLSYSFIVFGDLNGGGCEKNARAARLIQLMNQSDALFFIQTGDLVEGYGTSSCFCLDHPETTCSPGEESGNMRQKMQPLLNRTPPAGLKATYYPVIGNHDSNAEWYPDPCGCGICDFLNMNDAQVRSCYLTKPDVLNEPGFYQHTLNHGNVCDKSSPNAYPRDFYYSFRLRNSVFIVLHQNQDYSGMLSCNGGHPGYASCEDYCADETLFLDPERNGNCYAVEQYDWLAAELKKARTEGLDHIFVFAHAPLLTSSWNHPATQGSERLRALLERYNVTLYVNGHNHAYERSFPVRGTAVDKAGVTYITVGSAGASTDGIEGAWFTAGSYGDWCSYGDLEKMATYLKVTVNGKNVRGEVVSLGVASAPVDVFTIRERSPAGAPVLDLLLE